MRLRFWSTSERGTYCPDCGWVGEVVRPRGWRHVPCPDCGGERSFTVSLRP